MDLSIVPGIFLLKKEMLIVQRMINFHTDISLFFSENKNYLHWWAAKYIQMNVKRCTCGTAARPTEHNAFFDIQIER